MSNFFDEFEDADTPMATATKEPAPWDEFEDADAPVADAPAAPMPWDEFEEVPMPEAAAPAEPATGPAPQAEGGPAAPPTSAPPAVPAFDDYVRSPLEPGTDTAPATPTATSGYDTREVLKQAGKLAAYYPYLDVRAVHEILSPLVLKPLAAAAHATNEGLGQDRISQGIVSPVLERTEKALSANVAGLEQLVQWWRERVPDLKLPIMDVGLFPADVPGGAKIPFTNKKIGAFQNELSVADVAGEVAGGIGFVSGPVKLSAAASNILVDQVLPKATPSLIRAIGKGLATGALLPGAESPEEMVDNALSFAIFEMAGCAIGKATDLAGKITKTTPWRKMTIRERGLAVQYLEPRVAEMKAQGLSEAQILRTVKRTWGENSPEYREMWKTIAVDSGRVSPTVDTPKTATVAAAQGPRGQAVVTQPPPSPVQARPAPTTDLVPEPPAPARTPTTAPIRAATPPATRPPVTTGTTTAAAVVPEAPVQEPQAPATPAPLPAQTQAPAAEPIVMDATTATPTELDQAKNAGLIINRFPLSDVEFDPERFQYKWGHGARGQTGSLKDVNVYDPVRAGVISVWRDPANGKTYVVNGHNRAAKAIELGVQDHAVQFLKANTDREARALGALINISEGRGTVIDAAKYFRDSNITADEVGRLGLPLTESRVHRGIALSRLAQPLFDQVLHGQLEEGIGVIIGNELPDHSEQIQLMKLIKSRRGKLSASVIQEVAEIAKTTVPVKTESQRDLFGQTEEEKRLIIERAKIQSAINLRLSRDKNLFARVASTRAADRLGIFGNRIDPETNRAVSREAAAIQHVFNLLKSSTMSPTLDKAAKEVYDGRKFADVVEEIFPRIQTLVSQTLGRGKGIRLDGSEARDRHGSAPAGDTGRAGGGGPGRGTVSPVEPARAEGIVSAGTPARVAESGIDYALPGGQNAVSDKQDIFQFEGIADETLFGAARTRGVPESDLDAVVQSERQAIRNVSQTSGDPYPAQSDAAPMSVPAPGAGLPRLIGPEASRKAQSLAFQNPFNTEYWDNAFAMGETVSSVILDRIRRPDVRGWNLRGYQVGSAQHIAALHMTIDAGTQECFSVMYLDANRRTIETRIISVGLLDSSLVHPREVFGNMPAGTVIVVTAHNHPSGKVQPSSADLKVVSDINQAAKTAGVLHEDSVITNAGKFYSMRQQGVMYFGDQAGASKAPVVPEQDFRETPAMPDRYEWELVGRDELPDIRGPSELAKLAKAMSQHEATGKHHYVVYLNPSLGMTAVTRVPITVNAAGLAREVALNSGRHGAVSVAIVTPGIDQNGITVASVNFAAEVVQALEPTDITPLDVLLAPKEGVEHDYTSTRETGLVSFSGQSHQDTTGVAEMRTPYDVIRSNPQTISEAERRAQSITPELMEDPGFFRRWMMRLSGLVDVEQPFKLMGAPETGFALKNIFSLYAMAEEKAIHNGPRRINALLPKRTPAPGEYPDAAEVLFCASRPDRMLTLNPDQAEAIGPVVAYVRAMDDEMGAELQAWGVLNQMWPTSAIMRKQAELDQLADKIRSVESEHWKPTVRAEPAGKTTTVAPETLRALRAEALSDLAAQRAAIQADIDTLQGLKHVHLPVRMWLQDKFADQDVSTALGGTFSGIMGRNTMDPLEDLVRSGKIPIEKIDIRDAIAFYIRYVETQRAQMLIKTLAISEGLAIPTGQETRAGWARMDERRYPIFRDVSLHPAFADQLTRHFDDIGRPLSKIDRVFAFIKMHQFYNPIIMPMYDLYAAVALTQGAHLFHMRKAVMAVRLKTKDYWDCYENGGFSTPTKPLFENFVKELEKSKGGRELKSFLLSEAKKIGKNPLLMVETAYRLSWSAAWSLDHTVRMATYFEMRRRGYSPRMAAQLSAESSADYAGVPAGTRRALNRIFFTPTYQISMLKEAAKMIYSTTRLPDRALRAALGSAKAKQKLPIDIARFIMLATSIGMLMARDKIMTSLGFVRDQFSRKYYRIVKDRNGDEREAVITFADPINILQKYYYSFVQPKSGMTRMEQTAKYGRSLLHPAWVIAENLAKNERPSGEPIANPWDHPAVRTVKASRFVLGQVFRMYQDYIDDGSDTTKKETFRLLAEQGGPLDVYLKPFAFGYLRDPEGQRIQRQAARISSEFVRYLVDAEPANGDQLRKMFDRVSRQMDELMLKADELQRIEIDKAYRRMAFSTLVVDREIRNGPLDDERKRKIDVIRQYMGSNLPSVDETRSIMMSEQD